MKKKWRNSNKTEEEFTNKTFRIWRSNKNSPKTVKKNITSSIQSLNQERWKLSTDKSLQFWHSKQTQLNIPFLFRWRRGKHRTLDKWNKKPVLPGGSLVSKKDFNEEKIFIVVLQLLAPLIGIKCTESCLISRPPTSWCSNLGNC